MYVMIINPVSGNGSALNCLESAEVLLKKYGIDYRISYTESPLHAASIARKALADGAEGLIIAGGDGSISEALSGTEQFKPDIFFLPCGTGNDFMKTLGLPKDPLQALEKQLSLPAKEIDCAVMNGRTFINIAGTGFDSTVLKRLAKYKAKYKGLRAYLAAVVDSIKCYQPLECELSIDGGAFQTHTLTVLCAGNGIFFGGGMKAIPGARVDDGLLSLMLIRAVKKWQIPFFLPLFITGLHRFLPIVSFRAVNRVEIRAKGMCFQLDGELMDTDNASIRILPSSIRIHY